MSDKWIEIDIKGFRQALHNKGIPRIMLEVVSNALDTEAGRVDIVFQQANGRATLEVTDDDPEGFTNLRDAYTLYAPSSRRDDPTKRGRFGQGEKEVLAICADGGRVTLESTTGTVVFDSKGRHAGTYHRDYGTSLLASFKCNKDQAKEFLDLINLLLIPKGIQVTLNGSALEDDRIAVHEIQAILPTKIADEEGNLTDTRRQTWVEFIEPRSWETPTIFELGVPVVEHDGRFHINVGQKVPLNSARDNVTPSYLRKLRQLMLDGTYDQLTEVDLKQGWVIDALPTASPEALRSHVEAVHGKDAVIYDPSNPEASKRAIDQGRKVVYGGQYSSDTWNAIKQNEILKPAGQVIQTGVPTSPDGKPPIPREHWTPAMERVAIYTESLAKELLGRRIDVDFHNITLSGLHARAWWDGGVTFNLRYLGKRWPDEVSQEDLDALLLHEFTHNFVDDHFSDEFIRTTCRLGAKLRNCETQ